MTHVYCGARILVTGHTGFTGSWLTLWLDSLGAKVTGVALAPPTQPSLFNEAGIGELCDDRRLDIRDREKTVTEIAQIDPDLIVHLAAQPLVLQSYEDPVDSFLVNAMGTAHVLEGARAMQTPAPVVAITTDKVYRNRDWVWGYRETDEIGAGDPYSSSKACAEVIIDSYRYAFPEVRSATARGGNIIGGGDWAANRLVPDFVRCIMNSETLEMRNPAATRPWQHVLGLCAGYLELGRRLLNGGGDVVGSWNLGPVESEELTVAEVVDILSASWRPANIRFSEPARKEAGALKLDSSKARSILDWAPLWDARDSIAKTAAWYKGYYDEGTPARELMIQQLNEWA